MELRSIAFAPGEFIPARYTCDGENVNPPLTVADLSDELLQSVQSYALIVEDPDAPRGTFTHRTVWNIPPGINLIDEDNVPTGATEGMTDFGQSGYGGPCPPSGVHRYLFRLFALDSRLDLPQGAAKDELRGAIEDHILAEAELMGRYERGA